MIKQFILLTQFMTRIPIPIKVDYNEKDFGKSIKYFPILGLLIGLILYFVYFIAAKFTDNKLLIAVFLRNIDPLCRLWTVTVISQRRDDLIDFLVTHAINRRSIGSGGHTSVVGVYVFIREPIELRVVQISVQPFESVQFILGFFR